VKLVADVVDPPAFVTVIFPVVAPAGRVVTMLLVEVTANVANVPLNATLVVPTKLPPKTVTFVPTCAPLGENLRIIGFGAGKPFTT
jgi:hypothetical protein